MHHFNTEREGQIDFYRTHIPRIDKTLKLEDILDDNNDGVVNGNLLEFKLNVVDLNIALFQCIKYLSSIRVKGKPVPANVIILSLDLEKAWIYHSQEYLHNIEKVYIGAYSKENSGFCGSHPLCCLNYGDCEIDDEKLISFLKQKSFIKIHIDESDIVGWATTFYKNKPMARKEDFIGDEEGKHKTVGEIRKPTILKSYIYPYVGKDNIKFKYLMDKLNDTLQKKNLGAFYTPPIYAKKSLELVRMAIDRVPCKNDYVIIDRCAGTGNLESDFTDEELSHCILSTIEYYEYKVMLELLGDKVRHVIPPTETESTFNAGLVNGSDALSKEFINNSIIKQYIDNPHCTIILFENPPYAETTSIEHQKRKSGKKSSIWKDSFVVQKMKKEITGVTSNDLGNAFIWSAFKYYLRQPTDSYIVYSPVKYWKIQNLISRKFLCGFAFNRRYFHTNIDACIMVALWSCEKDSNTESINIHAYNIIDNKLVYEGDLSVNKVKSIYSKNYYDKRIFNNDRKIGILTGLNGLEAKNSVKKYVNPISNENILGYMVVDSSGFDNPDLHSSLLIAGRYNGHGFYLRKDNYLRKLPMFAASRYITYNRNWKERARIMKSADGKKHFEMDINSGKLTQFLYKCLLFTCLEMQNHMRTFEGSDGNFYRNELCLDITHGETIATSDLKKLKIGVDEQCLLNQWNSIFYEAENTEEYNSYLTYGIYQISDEINLSDKNEETGEIKFRHLELNSALKTLKTFVKEYYNKNIVPTLFKYEFLK